MVLIIHITVAGKENEPCDHMYDVTGGLCENSDKFAVNRMLPKIDMGDYIITMIQALTASQWAITITASFVLRKFC